MKNPFQSEITSSWQLKPAAEFERTFPKPGKKAKPEFLFGEQEEQEGSNDGRDVEPSGKGDKIWAQIPRTAVNEPAVEHDQEFRIALFYIDKRAEQGRSGLERSGADCAEDDRFCA